MEAPLDNPGIRPDTRFDNTRRKFLGTLTGALAAGLVVQILGCTEDPQYGAGPAPANGCPQPGGLAKSALDRSGSVSSNHGHVATVTTAQQDTGTAFNLSIQGSAGHNHTLALTAQDLSNLKAGAQLVKTTVSNDGTGHSHTVTFAMVTAILRPDC